MTQARQSAIVIGAGIVGVSSAVHLQRHGFQVTVVDRLAPGQGLGKPEATQHEGAFPTFHTIAVQIAA